MKNIFISTLLLFSMIVVSCEDDEATVEAPTARFNYTVDADNGLLVNFTNSSLNADTYSWDFGDGETSTDMSPSHTYAADGEYTVTLTATNSGGSTSASETLTLTSVLTLADLNDTWKIAPEAGSLAVGPSQGDGSWWSLDDAGVTTRACFLDDKYTLSADGSFSIEMDGETWLETWQADSETCGVPLAPHDGSGSYTYEATETTLTLVGEGAFMGLAKANNAGELPNVDLPVSITYTITEFVRDGSGKRLVLDIECGTGVWWRFTLVSQ